jgi:hypothetical protein
MRAKTCKDCGATVTAGSTKGRCRPCWKRRGPDTDGRAGYVATECGHKASRAGTRWCRACFDGQRAAIQKPSVGGHTVAAAEGLEPAIIKALQGGAKTLEQLGFEVGSTPGQALDALAALKAKGLNAHEFGGRWSLERHMPVTERSFEYLSRPDNTFVFGISSDQHLCSRYAREDVLAHLYDGFAAEGVDRVFNAGNWIDGEDEKNRFDLAVHGFEPQVKYLTERYPQRAGITTYAIWGEDHEGWYSRREAIDVGRFAEGQMRQAGRTDWVDLGFIEARVDLVNANTGVRNTLVVMHPGGGSSYAYSYRPQKIVESLSGGEKPGVLIIGHYHKMSCNVIRNVWTIQAGCTEDQTVFMRKKGLEAHVGGHIIKLEQDPETGAIFRCVSDQRAYYDKRYYNDRFSKTGPVVQAPRFQGGTVEARA